MSKHIVDEVPSTIVLQSMVELDMRNVIDRREPEDGAIVKHYNNVLSATIYVRRDDGAYEKVEISRSELKAITTAIQEVENKTFDAPYSSLPF